MKNLKTLAATTAILLCAAALPAQASDVIYPTKPFKADMTISAEGQNVPATLYGQGKSMRVELSQGGQNVVQIMDLENGEAFMLIDMAGTPTAMRMDVGDAMARFGMSSNDLGRSTGSKRIAGQSCKTYQIKAATVCLTKHNIALESVSPDGTMRVDKIKMGRQSADLFKVPAGYRVMDLGGLGGGFGADTFKDSDSVMEGLLGSLGQSGGQTDTSSSGGLSGIMGGINAIMDADDDDAAGQAAMDALMGQMGLPSGAITKDTTTAGVLTEGLDGMMYKDEAERQRAQRAIAENQRQMEILEREGMAGIYRDAGMSEAEIADLLKQQAEMSAKLEAHAVKVRAQTDAAANMDTSTLPSEEAMVDIQAEMDALNAKAEAMASDGHVSEADKDKIQNEAEKALKRLFGN